MADVQKLTCSKDLSQDAFLVAAVNVVWSLSSLVRPVEQTTIFRVAEEKLSQPAATPTNGNMERSVPFLSM